MRPGKFRALLDSVEMGSFSKAAQKMYITPASVMKQINALEEHLHVKLVNRTHRGIKLTV